MSEPVKMVRLQIQIPAWLDARMRERAIRKRGDLNKFFIQLLMKELGDVPLPTQASQPT